MKLGIIGGTGLYEMDGFKDALKVSLTTPFGPPSDDYIQGTLEGREVVFLSRHGRGHRHMPFEINHKANIYGFKTLGVEQIIGVSAVGSLREEFRPRDVFLPDQFFDRTKQSHNHTFFGHGIVAHITFSEPICPALRGAIKSIAGVTLASKKEYQGLLLHDGGTYVNMEGPAFSTKAESHYYRRCGFQVIGMTSLAEAKLCREAEICYATMNLVTDYDCWHESTEAVSVEMILENLRANTALAHDVLRNLAAKLPDMPDCSCRHALNNAIVTAQGVIPEQLKRDLQPIIGKYVR